MLPQYTHDVYVHAGEAEELPFPYEMEKYFRSYQYTRSVYSKVMLLVSRLAR